MKEVLGQISSKTITVLMMQHQYEAHESWLQLPGLGFCQTAVAEDYLRRELDRILMNTGMRAVMLVHILSLPYEL